MNFSVKGFDPVSDWKTHYRSSRRRFLQNRDRISVRRLPSGRYVRLLSFSSMGNLPLSMDSKKISSIIFHSKLIYFRCPNGHLISFLRTLSINLSFVSLLLFFLYFYQIFYCSSRNLMYNTNILQITHFYFYYL